MPSFQMIKISAFTVIGTAGVLLLSHSISKYGLGGTLRLIWEGDHLPPEIREALDELDDTEQTQIPKLIRKIDKIQIIIETAKLNTVDHDSQPITFTQTKDIIQNLPPVSLSKIKKDVGMVSHDLDCIAADIDSVRSLGNDEVKQQKKRLSSSVVTLMKRIDEYMDLCT